MTRNKTLATESKAELLSCFHFEEYTGIQKLPNKKQKQRFLKYIQLKESERAFSSR